jgi:penicillin-binding protein 2
MNRIAIFRLIVLATFTLFLFRLIDLQLIRGDRFRELANSNRLFRWQIPPERGVVLDRFGQPLMFNHRQYQVKKEIEALYPELQKIDQAQALAMMATNSARLEFELYRSYPWSDALAHVLGFVGSVTVEDLATNNRLKSQDKLGKLGLEKTWDKEMRGRYGFAEFEINALGHRQRVIFEQQAQAGLVIASSLDPYLSQVAKLALAGRPGAVVIEDAQTGQILSLVSSPSYDPNLLTLPHEASDTQHQQAIGELFNSESRPLFNRAVSGNYPPGSIFKLVTALAGLATDSLDAQTVVVDEGVLTVGDYSYSNWLYTALGRTDGPIKLVRAIARSNDIYFYKAAEWTGPEAISQMAKQLGLGQVTGIEIGQEAAGLIPNPAWKEETLGEKWYLGNTYHMGIGQGDVLLTPIQVAQLTQIIVNDGELCQPSVKFRINADDCYSLGLDPDHLELVRQGMLGACSPGGTAAKFFKFNAREETEPVPNSTSALDAGGVLCKTGTAEFGGANEQGARKTHAWFTMAGGLDLDRIDQNPALDIGELSADQIKLKQELYELRQDWLGLVTSYNLPQRVVITVLVESTEEEPYKEGSREAAQVARTIWDWMLVGV